EQFEMQSTEYKNLVLPPAATKRLAIEASYKDFWYKYTGLNGDIIGMTTFGESAPASELFALFGFTEEKVLGALSAL
ncbi:MAG: transketolase, partial [Bacteroidetes bacterium]|nr:transketolase [Bacteroidota bacterium]